MIFCDSRGLGYCSEIRCTGKPMLVWLLRVCWQHSNSSYQSHQCQQRAALAFFQPTGQPRLGGEMEMVATMDWMEPGPTVLDGFIVPDTFYTF